MKYNYNLPASVYCFDLSMGINVRAVNLKEYFLRFFWSRRVANFRNKTYLCNLEIKRCIEL